MKPAWAWAVAAWLCTSAGAAQAHLMPPQQGTLNLQGDGGYLVLSVPVSGLVGFDDDGDGRLSAAELQRHRLAIETQLGRQLRLQHGAVRLRLQGLMLDLSPPDENPGAPAMQLVVLGRYRLPGDAASVHGLRWAIELYGNDRSEQQYTLTVTRGPQRQTLVLGRGHREEALLVRSAFAPAWVRALVPGLLVGALLLAVVLGLSGWRGPRTAST